MDQNNTNKDTNKDTNQSQDHFQDMSSYGPSILGLLSCYILYKKPVLLFVYLFGYIINKLLNYFLKGTIKWPRPNEDMVKFMASMRLDNHIKNERYGMPSGGAQSMYYSLAFIYFSNLASCPQMICAYLITLITLLTRIYLNHHSFAQIMVGSIIGLLSGYLFFYYSQMKIRGPIQIRAAIEDYIGINS